MAASTMAATVAVDAKAVTRRSSIQLVRDLIFRQALMWMKGDILGVHDGESRTNLAQPKALYEEHVAFLSHLLRKTSSASDVALTRLDHLVELILLQCAHVDDIVHGTLTPEMAFHL